MFGYSWRYNFQDKELTPSGKCLPHMHESLSLLCCCCDKALAKNQLREGKGLFAFNFTVYHGRKSGKQLKVGIQRQKLKQWPRMSECCLLNLLSYKSQAYMLGDRDTTVAGSSYINRLLRKHSTNLSDARTIFIWGFSFPDVLRWKPILAIIMMALAIWSSFLLLGMV